MASLSRKMKRRRARRSTHERRRDASRVIEEHVRKVLGWAEGEPAPEGAAERCRDLAAQAMQAGKDREAAMWADFAQELG